MLEVECTCTEQQYEVLCSKQGRPNLLQDNVAELLIPLKRTNLAKYMFIHQQIKCGATRAVVAQIWSLSMDLCLGGHSTFVHMQLPLIMNFLDLYMTSFQFDMTTYLFIGE